MTTAARVRNLPGDLLHAGVTQLRTLRDQMSLRRAPLAQARTETLPAADDITLSMLLGPGASSHWEHASHLLRELDVPDGTGGVNPGDRRALFSIVAASGATQILEIGTHIGASTLHLAAALAGVAEQTGSTGKLVTVDIVEVNRADGPWRSAGASATPRDLLVRAGLVDQVEFVTAPSLTYLTGDIGPFDLIFLDGSHRAHLVYAEIAAATRALAPGGLIVLHDYYPDGQPLWPALPAIPGPYLAVERHRAQGADMRPYAMNAGGGV